MPEKIRKAGICVYCGRVAVLTADHIPPKLLFPKPRPLNLITVRSCNECNQGASKDDEYFRLATSIRSDIGGHPAASQVIPTVLRSLGKPEATGLTKTFIRSLCDMTILGENGEPVQVKEGFRCDTKRIERVATRITKGLYSHHFGQPLPTDHFVVTYSGAGLQSVDYSTARRVIGCVAKVSSGDPKRIGEGVFAYWHHLVPSCHGEVTVWLLVFYERSWILSMTTPANRSIETMGL